jgi:4-hydroxy-3-polyprenylbenzoate decarboxylase
VDPKEQRPEGPFGEFPGYYAGGVAEQPLIRVEGLYYRNNPIILGAPALKPPNARNYYRGALSSAIIWDALESARVPGVVGVWSYDFGFRLTVVAIKQRYPGHAKHVARVAALIPHAANRYLVVVDEDIDITDLNDVMWAMCTRVDAGKDIEFLSDCISTSLDPIIPPERKGYPVTTRVIIDAARPYDWRDRFPLVSTSSPELSQQILGRLGKVLESAGIRLKGPAK